MIHPRAARLSSALYEYRSTIIPMLASAVFRQEVEYDELEIRSSVRRDLGADHHCKLTWGVIEDLTRHDARCFIQFAVLPNPHGSASDCDYVTITYSATARQDDAQGWTVARSPGGAGSTAIDEFMRGTCSSIKGNVDRLIQLYQTHPPMRPRATQDLTRAGC